MINDPDFQRQPTKLSAKKIKAKKPRVARAGTFKKTKEKLYLAPRGLGRVLKACPKAGLRWRMDARTGTQSRHRLSTDACPL
ncbi:hypothetical protein B9G79_07990 [Bdellovibrio bacteriovorus]|uniref:Uncharacterized protein n=1 Tax=Bdellovibrio bacteriovorus TaxID=959 RepID=A0A1Z3N7R5_BDEBC|nr:hypothetical protein B9G79_07990 [Bdellovibrio bacteriovorus]